MTGERITMVDLAAAIVDAPSDAAYFANDVAVGEDGTAYVTDIRMGLIYHVDTNYEASVLHRFDDFGPNGIVYHSFGISPGGGRRSPLEGAARRPGWSHPGDTPGGGARAYGPQPGSSPGALPRPILLRNASRYQLFPCYTFSVPALKVSRRAPRHLAVAQVFDNASDTRSPGCFHLRQHESTEGYAMVLQRRWSGLGRCLGGLCIASLLAGAPFVAWAGQTEPPAEVQIRPRGDTGNDVHTGQIFRVDVLVPASWDPDDTVTVRLRSRRRGVPETTVTLFREETVGGRVRYLSNELSFGDGVQRKGRS